MQKFKGTPGPWESKTIHGDLKVIQKGSYEKLAPGMVSYRCVIRSDIENKHDAKLIAAAPELLESLQELFAHYKELADSGDAGNWKLEDQPVGKKAMAAIDKALGK